MPFYGLLVGYVLTMNPAGFGFESNEPKFVKMSLFVRAVVVVLMIALCHF